MKIYTEFNPAPWLRMFKFMELDISELSFLNFNCKATIEISLMTLMINGTYI